jgi:hypothetical protein
LIDFSWYLKIPILIQEECMFDFSKLGDLSKMASEAKQIQAKQERFHNEQIDLLKTISGQLKDIIRLLENRS